MGRKVSGMVDVAAYVQRARVKHIHATRKAEQDNACYSKNQHHAGRTGGHTDNKNKTLKSLLVLLVHQPYTTQDRQAGRQAGRQPGMQA